MLEQASDIQDAVGVEHESPKLIPVIVTMLPAESAVLTTLDALATGAAKRGSPRVLSATHIGYASRTPRERFGLIPSKLKENNPVLVTPRAITELRSTPPECDCVAHTAVVTEVQVVLKQFSDVAIEAVAVQL